MTNKQINIAIAEACGLTVVSDGISHNLTPCVLGTGKYSPEGKGLTFIPNYCNDLNAMHEVEKVLTIDQKLEYVDILRSFDGPVSRANSPVTWIYAHIATARQRAEAFLRTIGKWKEQN